MNKGKQISKRHTANQLCLLKYKKSESEWSITSEAGAFVIRKIDSARMFLNEKKLWLPN